MRHRVQPTHSDGAASRGGIPALQAARREPMGAVPGSPVSLPATLWPRPLAAVPGMERTMRATVERQGVAPQIAGRDSASFPLWKDCLVNDLKLGSRTRHRRRHRARRQIGKACRLALQRNVRRRLEIPVADRRGFSHVRALWRWQRYATNAGPVESTPGYSLENTRKTAPASPSKWPEIARRRCGFWRKSARRR